MQRINLNKYDKTFVFAAELIMSETDNCGV